MQTGTVYGLYHPDTDELRYVGVTQGTLSGRLKTHVCKADSHVWRVSNWIRKLRPKRPIIRALHENIEDALSVEVSEIAYRRELGARLCNMTDGGDELPPPGGHRGHTHSPEVRAEIGRKVSKALKGKPKSPEHVAAWVASRQESAGWDHDEETRERISATRRAQAQEVHVCPDCGRECKGKSGLVSHRTKAHR